MAAIYFLLHAFNNQVIALPLPQGLLLQTFKCVMIVRNGDTLSDYTFHCIFFIAKR
ncbi:hypothetical protein SAMN05444008_101132 [Cnuella takakiae]|uniref:Uncharacterized protein n=1 Tax=Cnuella takakiae TaxID=1302690 RepID=A0A1M4SII3_9BACT|nr:hypothetical protein SAMN05444008_101132 [Cnuella takakiae]